jgi:hypothetical protein
MRLQGFGVGVFGAIAAIAIVLALATVWLFLTNPVTVANSVNEGTVSPFVRDLAAVLFAALQGLLKYL